MSVVQGGGAQDVETSLGETAQGVAYKALGIAIGTG